MSLCVPACGSSTLSRRSSAWRVAWGQKGASVVRTGGAEALWSTVPPWLPVGLGSRQVPGKLGTQVSLRLGPQDVQRSLGRGGWEPGGPEDRHLQGPAGLSSEWDRGWPRSASAAGSGVAGGGTAPRPPHPSAHTPGPARTHACPPGHWVVLEALRAPGPGQTLAGLVLAVFGGRAGVSRLESGRGSCGSNTARPPTRGAARWPDLQVGAKGRRSARLLGRPAPTASVSGHISLKALDLVCSQKLSRVGPG